MLAKTHIALAAIAAAGLALTTLPAAAWYCHGSYQSHSYYPQQYSQSYSQNYYYPRQYLRYYQNYQSYQNYYPQPQYYAQRQYYPRNGYMGGYMSYNRPNGYGQY